MSKATFAFGRFNPPTEAGHGKLVSAVQSHAEETGGTHYIFASHSQDKKKNPLHHSDKVGAMRKMFKGANVVGGDHKTVIDAMKHLQKQGHTHVTMVAGSDRVEGFKKLLNDYNGKEYKFKKIDVKSAGQRDPDAEGAEGMSASKLRGLVSAGKKDEFISHYSDKKLGKEIHDKVKSAMSEDTITNKAMFIIGGPGSGKDYVINNILSKFNLNEVQADQILHNQLIEGTNNILINCGTDIDKIEKIKALLEGFDFSHIVVTVSNKVSRERNSTRDRPLDESVRIRKWLESEQISEKLENCFQFKNTMNITEASQFELLIFQEQIKNILEFVLDNDYVMEVKTIEPKSIFKYTKNRAPKSKVYEKSTIDLNPVLTTKKDKVKRARPISDLNAQITGQEFMTPGNNLVQENMLGFKNYVQLKEATISEAVEYHLTKNIPISENVFRPGSDKFFELMLEGKKLFSEGKYSPIDDYEADMLRGDIGEFAEYNGELVPLDFPFLEEESDPTNGKGIGKPWREGGGGAVYVKNGDKVKKVRFSQSGMEKKYNDPARLKSFMARHNCLGNTDKTSAGYWACRWPRFFSKSGQLWW